MTNFSDMIKSSPFYRSMMEQVPENERNLVEEQLASILQHYNAVTSALPGGTLTEMSRAMSSEEPVKSIDGDGSTPTKRAPRRF